MPEARKTKTAGFKIEIDGFVPGAHGDTGLLLELGKDVDAMVEALEKKHDATVRHSINATRR